jgi:hypothetical protein
MSRTEPSLPVKYQSVTPEAFVRATIPVTPGT